MPAMIELLIEELTSAYREHLKSEPPSRAVQ